MTNPNHHTTESERSPILPVFQPVGELTADFVSRLREDRSTPGTEKKEERFYSHPDFPSLLIRKEDHIEGEGAQNAIFTRYALDQLRIFGVSTIDSVAASGPKQFDYDDIYTFVPRLEGVTSLDDLLVEGASEVVLDETDTLVANLATYVKAVQQQGGVINLDQLPLGQFVGDMSQPEGQRTVLVDAEAGYPKLLTQQDESSIGARAAVLIAKNVIQLKELVGDKALRSEQQLYELLDALPESKPEVTQMKIDLRQALASGDHDIIHEMLISAGDEELEDEEVPERMQYWRNFEQRTLGVEATHFNSVETAMFYVASGNQVTDRELTLEELNTTREYIEQATTSSDTSGQERAKSLGGAMLARLINPGHISEA